MQISSTSSIYQVTNQSSYSKNTDTDKNYLTMSLDDIKDLPYNEVKSNLEDISKNLNNKSEKNAKDSLEIFAVKAKIHTIDGSNNQQYNQALFNTLGEIDDPFSIIIFQKDIQNNLGDYHDNKNIKASFVVESNTENYRSDNNLTKKQISNIDMGNFISKMLTTFTEDLSEAKGDKIKKQYQDIVDGYGLLQKYYNQAIKEPLYA